MAKRSPRQSAAPARCPPVRSRATDNPLIVNAGRVPDDSGGFRMEPGFLSKEWRMPTAPATPTPEAVLAWYRHCRQDIYAIGDPVADNDLGIKGAAVDGLGELARESAKRRTEELRAHLRMIDVAAGDCLPAFRHGSPRQKECLALMSAVDECLLGLANANAATPAGNAEKNPPNPFIDLLTFARTSLSGKERRAVELVCEQGGKYKIADMAVDSQIDWSRPYDNALNGLRQRINKKLKAADLRWRFYRQKNALCTHQITASRTKSRKK